MKRMHLHIGVDDIQKSVGFYSAMFNSEPSVLKDDYAKWQLDDPKVNFAISNRGHKRGLDHLGIQVDNDDELSALRSQLDKAETPVLHQGETTCCYAESDKSWVIDPQGIAWEAYRTMGEAKVYGDSGPLKEDGAACCTPSMIPVSTGSNCC